MMWLYSTITHDYILTIVIATVVFKCITLPFDLKQRKSSRKMSALQPEMQKLQKRYANDPQKLQAKQAELYKKNNVNMYASCLPLLLTWPFFIIFFGGLRLLANEMNVQIALEIASGNVEFLDNFRFLWIRNIFQPDSGVASVVMSLKDFTNLMDEKQLNTLFMLTPEIKQAAIDLLPNYEKLVIDAANAHVYANAAPFLKNMLGEGGTFSNGWFILPLVAGAAALFQSKIMSASQPQPAGQQGMGKMMLYVTAGISVWFCATSNTIFSVYWITSNVFGLATHFILNKIYPPASEGETDIVEGRGTVK